MFYFGFKELGAEIFKLKPVFCPSYKMSPGPY